MKDEWSAVILAGGLGTRLSPLTTYICKPQVCVTNKPMIDYAIDHLQFAGIKKIIVCVKQFGEELREYLLKKWTPVMNEDPEFQLQIPNNDSKGTADAVRQVWDLIETENFVVSMADIVTNLPMKEFMNYHIKKNADSTISMKPIDEFATKYGNTVLDSDGRILLFMEKPSSHEIFISSVAGTQDQNVLPIINTGIYCFKREIARQVLMETNFMDFGKEIFPFLLENKYGLYGFVEKYYWLDVGNPRTYLWANWDILREYGWPVLPNGKDKNNEKIWRVENSIIPLSTKISKRICLGKNIYFGEEVNVLPLSVIGNNVKIGNNTTIEKSVIWDNVEIGENCSIVESVVADGCKIGNNVTVRTDSIIGPNVKIEDNILLDATTIDADQVVKKQ